MPRVINTIKCSRSISISSNALVLLCGIALLGLGIFIVVSDDFSAIIPIYNITQSFGGENMLWIGVMIIIMGVFLTALTIFGWFITTYQYRISLYLYAILMILIILLELSVIIVGLQFRNDIWHSYDSGFEEIFQNAYQSNENQSINAIESLEQQLSCCGVDSPNDYISIDIPIPQSCYPDQLVEQFPFTQGCASAVVLWIWDKFPIIIAVVMIVLFVEIISIVSSLILAISIGHRSDYEQLLGPVQIQ